MFRLFFLVIGLVFTLIAFPVSESSADLVLFDFANTNTELDGSTAGGTMTRSGAMSTVTMTTLLITAPDFNNDPTMDLQSVDNETNISNNNDNGGLGVNNDTISNTAFRDDPNGGATTSESSNFNFMESLTFEFDQDVTFHRIDFATLGANESFRINVAGNPTNFDFVDGTTSDIFTDPLSGLLITAGTDITFTALGSADITNIRVDEFTVHVAAVPEPTSLGFLTFGIGLMMVRRRR